MLIARVRAAPCVVMVLSAVSTYGCHLTSDAPTLTPVPTTSASMLLIAHRGAVHAHPENTLSAIIAAAELDSDGIEFDVQRSADGTWWVMHDMTVDRTTNGSGALSEMADDEIRQLAVDGGAGYAPHHDDARLGVPSLSEVLDRLAAYSGWLYIDLKERADEAHASLAAHVEEHGVASRTTILCKSETGAAEVKKVSPSIRTLMMTAGDQPPHDLAPSVDGWLGNAAVVVRDGMTLDLPYDVELFADLTRRFDERLIIQPRYVDTVGALITNDVVAARRLLAAVRPTSEVDGP